MPRDKRYNGRSYIAKTIVKARVDQGMSVSGVSRDSGVSRPTINKIERGEAGQVTELLAVANAVGLDLEFRLT